MTARAEAVCVQLHCHHCQRWMGETSLSLTFVGMFKRPEDRALVVPPRDTWRCKSCGWINVFQAEVPDPRSWRQVSLK